MGLLGLRPVQAVTIQMLQAADGMGRIGKELDPLSLCPQVSNWWEDERGDSFRQHSYVPCKGTPGTAHSWTGNLRGSTWNHKPHSMTPAATSSQCLGARYRELTPGYAASAADSVSLHTSSVPALWVQNSTQEVWIQKTSLYQLRDISVPLLTD